MKRIPRLASVMTPFPYSIDVGETAARAQEVMNQHGFRHLPVTKDYHPVSLITAGSIREKSLELRVTSDQLKVAEACAEAYLVDLSTPLDVVVEEMAKRHVGSVVVTKGDKVAGIFTTVDACGLLAKTLRGEAANPDDVA